MSKRKSLRFATLRFAIGVGLILFGLSLYIPAVAADTAGAILERRLRIQSKWSPAHPVGMND